MTEQDTTQGNPATKKDVSRTAIFFVIFSLMTIADLFADASDRLPPELDSVRIHAIAWFEEPEKRIVVINNEVLKEGMSFGAFTVMEIRSDQVEILYKGQRFVKTFENPIVGAEPAGPESHLITPAEAPPVLPKKTEPPNLSDEPLTGNKDKRYHEVRAGENLFRIGLRYNLNVEVLRRLNNLPPDATMIQPGQKLVVSPAGSR
ncbi:MAG: LysM peptidoglycan-binding domain-containing protein [Desulfobacterales bacterium]|nr:LysM peptidoglycan-binding domain-containing protein [Desulfobacterales bacterium]